MLDKGQNPEGSIHFGAVTRAFKADEPCGDGHMFYPLDHHVLFALVDGLGHGRAAHQVAVETLNSFKAHADLPLEDIIWATHERLRDTRGCAAFLGKISTESYRMECVNIGNISCKINTNSDIRPINHAGVLGQNIRRVAPVSIPLQAGDLVALSSDGISSKFNLDEFGDKQPADLAREICHLYGYSHDDASVLIIRLGNMYV